MGRGLKTVALVILLVGVLLCLFASHNWVPAIGDDAPGVMTRNLIPMLEIFGGLILIVIGLVVFQFGAAQVARQVKEGDPPSHWWRTCDLLILALFFVGIAILFRPPPMQQVLKGIGDHVLMDFRKPNRAEGLDITRFDAATGEPAAMQVAFKDGRWVIASHDDYPADAADAKERIRDLANDLVDMKILGTPTVTDKSQHNVYGVVDPTDKDADRTGGAAGTLFSVRDAKNNKIAGVIIGKKVEGQQKSRDKTQQRYVRLPDRTEVYVTRLNEENLKTRFYQWVEPDLLKLRRVDVDQLTLNDYIYDPTKRIMYPDGRVRSLYEHPLEVVLDYDFQKPVGQEWSLVTLKESQGDNLQETKLGPDEEIDQKTLGTMLTALENLKIVNATSRPPGLIKALLASGDGGIPAQIQQVLDQLGFFVIQDEVTKQPALLSSNGEVLVDTKDGIRYTLRFGNAAGMEESEEGDDQARLKRYLMISASVNPDAFVVPEKETPPADEPGKEPEEKPVDDTGDDTDDETQPPAQPEKEPADKDETGSGEPTESTDPFEATEETKPAGGEGTIEGEGGRTSSFGTSADDDGESAEDAAADSADEEEDGDGGTDDLVPPSSEEQDPEADPADPAPEKTPAVDPAVAEMRLKRQAAEKKVAELNKRFDQWFYIIPEDVYKKIHLTRRELIKKKTPGMPPGRPNFPGGMFPGMPPGMPPRGQ